MSSRMPVLFVGHGSPMNAVEQNDFTRTWRQLGESIPRPAAILSVSAHWYTDGFRIQTVSNPRQIYDMYGFPRELYELKYRPAGSPELADRVIQLTHAEIQADNSWGIDHGTWAVLCNMYPREDIPVVQLSVNRTASFQEQYAVGQDLKLLRDKNILIFTSGNIVHNLGMIDWNKDCGFGWADSFDAAVRDAVVKGDVKSVMKTATAGKEARLALPSPDHFMPLMYALGAAGADRTTVFNDARTFGSLSMTGFVFG